MAWTAPTNVATGDVLTATRYNNEVVGNGTFLAIPNMCRARSTTATSIPQATATPIPLAAADSYDTAAMHSTTVNNTRVTVGLVGVYSITGQAYFAVNAAGLRVIIIYKNGAEMQTAAVPPQAGETVRFNITALDYASAVTDYYELGVYQTSGGALALSGIGLGGETASLAVTYMGATA